MTLKPANSTYFSIQALRVVAALLVVVNHAMCSWRDRIVVQPQVPVWQNAQAGVDIFFVISGFVMAVSTPGLEGAVYKGWIFFRRRLIRIVPLYWIFTTLKLVRLKFGPAFAHQTAASTWYIVASYLFIPAGDNRGNAQPLLAVGWTLSFEMMFYVFFAIALALDLAPQAFLVPALGAVAVIGCFDHPTWPAFTALASPLVLEFLLGVALGNLALQQRVPNKLVSTLLLVGGFAVILTIQVPSPTARALVWGLPAAAIVLGAVGLERQAVKILPAWLLEAGNASYSIYLAHLFLLTPIRAVLMHLGRTGTSALVEMIVLSIVLNLFVGEIVHRLIEVPCMTLFRGKRVSGVTALPV